MPGAVNETPHATMIWNGTDLKKGPEPLMEPVGSAEATEDMANEWQTKEMNLRRRSGIYMLFVMELCPDILLQSCHNFSPLAF
jgi:hypothetical protein